MKEIKMLAFHNDQTIKEKYLTRVRAHAAADAIIQGTGWEDGKGCAVGCTLENYDHSRYPIELGIPKWLALVEDTLAWSAESARSAAVSAAVSAAASARYEYFADELLKLLAAAPTNKGSE